ncbi:OmpA family protein [Alloprevotella sp. OH1205_COT-284]|uniref:OmpA family protein n=1 Tax=Alloprevotella sp. OH1205_COT-284 TaxID=2491043 RepID=UPI000F5E03FA|nr:OmpA family protein [Alloprevotella sp. OH1205_COT-284]RRD78251.1 OmpA family protein [Alloprevotella sp. OH1205_COT-284]
MKSIKTLVLALCASLMFAACGEWNNKMKGGLIGGGGGAALGSLVGYLISKDGKGTAIGAAIGTAVGSGAGVYIGNRMDKAKAAAAAVENAKAEVLEGPNGVKYVKVTFDSGILFATGNAQLTPSAMASLNKFAAEVLQTNNDMDVAIMGYTDNAGWRNSTPEQSKAKNQALSLQRAQSVFNYLVQSGARTSQIKEVKGLGEDYPVADNNTVLGKTLNRRVEVYLYASQQMIQAANARN